MGVGWNWPVTRTLSWLAINPQASAMEVRRKVLALINRKPGLMFALNYFTVPRVREDGPFAWRISSHLLVALRWFGWWVSTCRLGLRAGNEDSQERGHRFEKHVCRTRLVPYLFEQG
jgi:hypothetical protein